MSTPRPSTPPTPERGPRTPGGATSPRSTQRGASALSSSLEPMKEVMSLGKFAVPDAIQCACVVGSTVWTGERGGWVRWRNSQNGSLVAIPPQRGPQDPPRYYLAQRRHVEANAMVLVGEETTVWVGYSDGFIRVYKVDGEEVTEMLQHDHAVTCLLVVGRFVYSGGLDCKIFKWDTKTHDQITIMNGHTNGLRCMSHAVSFDGSYTSNAFVSGSDDGTSVLWEKDKMRGAYRGHAGAVVCGLHTGLHFWSAGEDCTIRVFNAETFMPLKTICHHTAPVTSLVFNEGEYKVWSAGRDGRIGLWDPTTFQRLESLELDERLKTTCIVPLHRTSVWRLWTCSSDGTVEVWLSQAVDDNIQVKETQREVIEVRQLLRQKQEELHHAENQLAELMAERKANNVSRVCHVLEEREEALAQKCEEVQALRKQIHSMLPRTVMDEQLREARSTLEMQVKRQSQELAEAYRKIDMLSRKIHEEQQRCQIVSTENATLTQKAVEATRDRTNELLAEKERMKEAMGRLEQQCMRLRNDLVAMQAQREDAETRASLEVQSMSQQLIKAYDIAAALIRWKMKELIEEEASSRRSWQWSEEATRCVLQGCFVDFLLTREKLSASELECRSLESYRVQGKRDALVCKGLQMEQSFRDETNHDDTHGFIRGRASLSSLQDQQREERQTAVAQNFEKQLFDLEAKVAVMKDCTMERNNLQRNLAEKEVILEERNNEIARLSHSLAKWQSLYQRQSEEVHALRENNDIEKHKLDAEIVILRKDANRHKHEVASLQNTILQSEEETKRCADELSMHKVTTRKHNAESRLALDSISAQLTEAERQISVLKSELSRKTTEMASMQTLIAEKDANAQQALETAATLRANAGKYTTERAHMQRALLEAETMAQVLQADADHCKRRLQIVLSQLEERTKEAEENRRALAEWSDVRSIEWNRQRSALEVKLQEQQSKLSALQSDRDTEVERLRVIFEERILIEAERIRIEEGAKRTTLEAKLQETAMKSAHCEEVLSKLRMEMTSARSLQNAPDQLRAMEEECEASKGKDDFEIREKRSQIRAEKSAHEKELRILREDLLRAVSELPDSTAKFSLLADLHVAIKDASARLRVKGETIEDLQQLREEILQLVSSDLSPVRTDSGIFSERDRFLSDIYTALKSKIAKVLYEAESKYERELCFLKEEVLLLTTRDGRGDSTLDGESLIHYLQAKLKARKSSGSIQINQDYLDAAHLGTPTFPKASSKQILLPSPGTTQPSQHYSSQQPIYITRSGTAVYRSNSEDALPEADASPPPPPPYTVPALELQLSEMRQKNEVLENALASPSPWDQLKTLVTETAQTTGKVERDYVKLLANLEDRERCIGELKHEMLKKGKDPSLQCPLSTVPPQSQERTRLQQLAFDSPPLLPPQRHNYASSHSSFFPFPVASQRQKSGLVTTPLMRNCEETGRGGH